MVTDSELSRKKFLANCVFIFKLINISPFCLSVRGKYERDSLIGIFYLVLVALLYTTWNGILGVFSAAPEVGLDPSNSAYSVILSISVVMTPAAPRVTCPDTVYSHLQKMQWLQDWKGKKLLQSVLTHRCLGLCLVSAVLSDQSA